jgi:hypothetical protein
MRKKEKKQSAKRQPAKQAQDASDSGDGQKNHESPKKTETVLSPQLGALMPAFEM